MRDHNERGDPEGSRGEIHNWVEEKTNDKIKVSEGRPAVNVRVCVGVRYACVSVRCACV